LGIDYRHQSPLNGPHLKWSIKVYLLTYLSYPKSKTKLLRSDD